MLFVAACEETPNAQQKDSENRARNTENLLNQQPSEGMDYSPTREGINKWMETWEEKGKLAYIYIINDGNILGYYVFEGLPISYCASNVPKEEVNHHYEYMWKEDKPAMDGAYYSDSQCNQYYGYDATSGSYIEFTVGGEQNYFLTEQPLPRQDVEPLGPSTIEDVKANNG